MASEAFNAKIYCKTNKHRDRGLPASPLSLTPHRRVQLPTMRSTTLLALALSILATTTTAQRTVASLNEGWCVSSL